MLPELQTYYQKYGFTLISSQKPPVAVPVEAVRVIVTRGFGGVILSTRRLIVPMTRESELDYHDTLNDDNLPHSEFEAWRFKSADDSSV